MLSTSAISSTVSGSEVQMAQIVSSVISNTKTSRYFGRCNQINVSSSDNAIYRESKRGMINPTDRNMDGGEIAKLDTNIAGDEILSLNVGGKIYQCKESTLKSRRYGLLSHISAEHESYNASTGSYFFDRNPKIFEAILEFYRTGKLHIKTSFCVVELEEEMKYWEVDEDCISDCCWRRFSDLQEERSQNCRVMSEFTDVCQILLARMKGLSQNRERLWVTLDAPLYTKTAKGIEAAYLLMVLVSFLTSCTLSFLLDMEGLMVTYSENSTLVLEQQTMTSAKTHLHYLELACLSIVTPFVLVRAVVCPDKLVFWASPLNILDMLYLMLSWPLSVITIATPWHISAVVDHIVMSVGVLRVFRAARHHRGVRELWYAIRASFREVRLLLIFVLLSVIIFGTAFNCVERSSTGGHQNIFLSFWWALVTMTTLGYGDIVPTAPIGFIVASICSLIGLVMISLPIPFIAHNFRLYYGYRSRFCKKIASKKHTTGDQQ